MIGTGNVHNVDQRCSRIRFEDDAVPDGVVEAEQYGSNSDHFVMGTSSVIWPPALLFSKHLCRNSSLVKGKRCVELGAGVGLVGMVAAALGADVVMTDLEAGLPLLEVNAARSKAAAVGGSIKVAELFWGNEQHIEAVGRHTFDVVLVTDAICHQEVDVMRALAHSISELLTADGACFLSYEFRDDWCSAADFQDAAKVLVTMHLFCSSCTVSCRSRYVDTT
jgi:predicted nicotinamide N-methyase